MILEAASYALALREVWPSLADAWATRMVELGVAMRPNAATACDSMTLVALAPAAFWQDWSSRTAKGRNKLGPATWAEFGKLVDVLRERCGLKCQFVSVSGGPEVPASLALQPLPHFLKPQGRTDPLDSADWGDSENLPRNSPDSP